MKLDMGGDDQEIIFKDETQINNFPQKIWTKPVLQDTNILKEITVSQLK